MTQQKTRRGAWFRNRDVLVRTIIMCWMLITVFWKDNALKIRFFLKGIISLVLNCCVAFPGQLVVCTLCSCVMKTKQIWLFSAHLLPLLARLCLVPLETIVIINKFAMIFTGLEVLYFLASNLLVPYNLAKSAYRELVQVGWWMQPFCFLSLLCRKEVKKPHFSCLLCTCVCVLTHPFLANRISPCPWHLLSLIYVSFE